MAETKKYLHNIDVTKNKLTNFILNPATTAQRIAIGLTLTTTHQGYVVYDTDENSQYFWDGAQWIVVGGGSIPTLQQVVNVSNGISNFGGIGNASIQSTNFTNGRTLLLNDNSAPAIKIIDNANASNFLQIDLDTLNIDGTSYNWSSIVNQGTVTDVTATSPLFSSGGTTPNITIQQSSGSQDGYLSSTDWTTFNGKQNAITTGTTSQYFRGDLSLATFPTIPAAQIQSDWNQTNNALLDYIKNKPTIPTVGTWGALNYPTWTTGTPFVKMTAAGTFALDTNTYLTSAVTSVATAGLISGGTITGTGTITTSMATNKLVGRSSAGTGVMEEITIGSGLTLTGAGVLNNTASATPTGYYGAWEDMLTQTAAVSNVGYPLIYRTIDLENQVRVVTNGTNLTRITFDNTGIYNLQFSVQIQNTDNAQHDVTIWLRKNGTDVTGSAGFISVPARKSAGAGNEGHGVYGWNYLLSVVAGEYYEIVWSTSNAANVTIQYYAAGSPPPSTASVIATVTQQSGIMAGTGITAINSLTGAAQTLTTGTTGGDFAIVSSGTTHTFNIPDASASARGLVTTGAQTLAGAKTFSTAPILSSLTASQILALDGSGNIQSLATATYPSLTELSYVKGVTSSIQTQIGTKQATITGGATTITSSDLTASRALISNSSGKVAVSTTTDGELNFLSGASSNIQTQINNKFTTPTGWTDYLASSAIVGSSGTTGFINYVIMGKVMFLSVSISGTSTATNWTFTIPGTSAAYIQFGQGHAINNNTTQGALYVQVTASTNVVSLMYNNLNLATGLTAWTNTNTKQAKFNMILNIV